MVSEVVQLFKPSKPSVAPVAARSQNEQDAKIKTAEARERREKRSRDKVIASRQGRRGAQTLFQQTGELGVPKKETLGGK